MRSRPASRKRSRALASTSPGHRCLVGVPCVVGGRCGTRTWLARRKGVEAALPSWATPERANSFELWTSPARGLPPPAASDP
eukprot:scaffold11_cov257-Pinguiococcus_pyrenoidosus.AAC.32